MSLCVEHMACCLLLVPCTLLSIVSPLPSYLIIVSVAPPVSPSFPSFVSLFILLVSVVLCWSVVLHHVYMLSVHGSLPVCFFGFCLSLFYFVIKKTLFLLLSPRLHLSSWFLTKCISVNVMNIDILKYANMFWFSSGCATSHHHMINYTKSVWKYMSNQSL